MANHWANRVEGWRTGGSVLRRIVAGTTVVTATTVAVKAFSLAKDVVIAHRYGAGDELDAYFYVVAYLGFVGAVVIGSFEVSFLPVYVRLREEQGPAAAQRLLGDAATLLSAFLLGALFAFVAVSRQVLPLLVAGFGPDKIRLTQALMVWLIPFLWWHALFVLYRAVLISSERFLLGAAAPAWLSIGLLLFVGCGGRHWGAGALVAGTLVGYLAQLMTAAVGLRHAGVSPRLTWHGLTPELRQILTQSAPMAGAMLISAASPIVDQSLAASLPAGSVAVLGYGYKLTALVLGLTEGLHLGVFPYLAQMVARREVAALSRTLRHGIRAVLLLTVALVAVLIAASHPLVALAFEHGEFTPDVTAQVVEVQRLYLLQLPGAVLGILFMRLLNAARWNGFLTLVGISNFAINLVVDLILIRFYGLRGLAMSSALVATTSCLMMGAATAVWFARARQGLA